MKKSLLFLAFVSFCGTLISQIFPHTLTVLSEQSYTPLQGATSANPDGLEWDDPDWDVPIGFTFNYLGEDYDMISFGGLLGYGGEIMFGAYGDGVVRQTLGIYMQDLVDANYGTGEAALSPVRYTTTGAVGSRIFKLEWTECAFYPLGENVSPARISLQLWLYETSNQFEYRYGAFSNPDDDIVTIFSGYCIGIGKNVNIQTGEVEAFWTLTGDPVNPIIATYNSIFDIAVNSLLDETPPNGLVYRFVQPTNISVIEAIDHMFDLQSTVVKDHLILNYYGASVASLQIYGLEGKLCHQENLFPGVQTCAVNMLPAGTYLVGVSANSKRYTKRFVKVN